MAPLNFIYILLLTSWTWELADAATVHTCPTVLTGCAYEVGDTIVLQMRGDVLVQLDSKTGKEIAWRPIPGIAALTTTLDAQQVCTATRRSVGCLDNSLEWNWQVLLDPKLISGAVRLESGNDFLAVNGGAPDTPQARMRVIILDLKSGRQLWWSTTSWPGATTTSKFVVYRDGQGSVVLRDGRSGRIIWKRPVESTFGALGVTSHSVVAASSNGVVWSFNIIDGSVQWSSKINLEVGGGAKSSEDHILDVGAGRELVAVMVSNKDGTTQVVGLGSGDGSHLWTSQPLPLAGMLPLEVKGKWVLGVGGFLSCPLQLPPIYTLNPSTGAFHRELEGVHPVPDAHTITSTSGSKTVVYHAYDEGRVEKRSASGDRIWLWRKAVPMPPDCIPEMD